MKLQIQLYGLFFASMLNLVTAFGGSEEKFIKKYALMKVYESCFGRQVLNEIRKEMKEAAEKCSGFQPYFGDKYFSKDGSNIKQGSDSDWLEESPQRLKPGLGTKVKKPIHTTDTLLLQQWTEEQKLTDSDGLRPAHQNQSEAEVINGAEVEIASSLKKPIDFSKLEEVILNTGKPSVSFGLQKHGSTNSNFQQSAAVGYYPAMYYPPPVPFAPSYPYHYYSGYFHPPAPAGSAAFQSIYRSGLRAAKITNFNSRSKKQSDAKSQMSDFPAFQYSSKIRNASCIMQELGYLDEHLEPNYSRMSDRINRLLISEELKKDMLDGVKFCRQFSQCIPDTRKDSFQLSKELLRPMFFFRCYKHKKLESCIMKDIKERFSQTTADLNNEIRRSFRNSDITSVMFNSVFGLSVDDYESLF